jgi:hypothetical protein
MAQAIKIMLIRHAEKPGNYDGKRCDGVEFDGDKDKDSLAVRGWQRAGALCVLFGSARMAASRGLAVPDHLYASDPDKSNDSDKKSRRNKETLGPLSRLLGIDITLGFVKGQEAEVAASAVARGGTVLIAWSHERLPDIAKHIPGGDVTAPRDWPDDCYDVVWVFDLGADGRYSFQQVPQALLAGDRPATAGDRPSDK